VHVAYDVRVRPGRNIFLAETSATCGGLDSLLEPHGTIKAAQELAAQTFGSDRSFWVTNGTSTANKIVVQGLVRPGDIVLVDRSAIKPLFVYYEYFFIMYVFIVIYGLTSLQKLSQVAPPGPGAGRRLGRVSGGVSAAPGTCPTHARRH
jgi:hypothetical protein